METCGIGFSSLSQISRLVRSHDRKCLRAKGHEGSHLVYDTVQNKYYFWKSDLSCGECDVDDSCCDIYEQVSEEIAQVLLLEQAPVSQLAS